MTGCCFAGGQTRVELAPPGLGINRRLVPLATLPGVSCLRETGGGELRQKLFTPVKRRAEHQGKSRTMESTYPAGKTDPTSPHLPPYCLIGAAKKEALPPHKGRQSLDRARGDSWTRTGLKVDPVLLSRLEPWTLGFITSV
ncbi:hypothetical protein DPEC_G00183820 [Dallia pectoralis]|uniref:Uncharacterized protein n=1 Tax=Dallia pectoralis TaxID=75939 RepID=A0ACC2GAU7_DALPE|nr:hypothetical protein DPEC_G00183820 [Dallia pectoralis]